MFSATRSLYSLTSGHRLQNFSIKLIGPTGHNLLSRHTSLAYSTSNRTYAVYNAPNQESSPKIKLADKIKTLHEKARPFAIPNLISATRFCLSPITCYFILNDMSSHALICFAAAMLTDVADKASAKLLKYNSGIQPVVDFIADRTFIMTTMFCLFTVDMMPFWLIRGLMFREILFIIGAPLFRYLSFPESVSLKKFFDFHNYPTLGLEPSVASRMLMVSQYSLFAYYLYQTSIGATPLHGGWGLFVCEMSIGILAATTSAIILERISRPLFYTRPVKQ